MYLNSSEDKIIKADYEISKTELEKTKELLTELENKMLYNDIVVKVVMIYIALVVTVLLVVLMII